LTETFKKAINALTVQDKGDAEIRDSIKLRQTRPFVAKDQGYLIPKKSVFNKILGDSRFELLFARFLEDCDDVVSYAKNYMAVHFKLDYVNADGDISNYYGSSGTYNGAPRLCHIRQAPSRQRRLFRPFVSFDIGEQAQKRSGQIGKSKGSSLMGYPLYWQHAARG